MKAGFKHKVGQHAERLKGYEIVFGLCTRCGEEVSQTEGKPYECPQCHSTDRSQFRQNQAAIPAKRVEDIINRKSVYQCVKCGREYDHPTPCCYADRTQPLNNSQEWQKAWFCPGCRNVYFEDVKSCCEGHELIPGKGAVDLNGTKRTLLNAK